MTWKEVSPMEERIRFAVLAEREEKSMRELCKEFSISRKTGYKWLNRYRMLGVAGMRELSRRPIHCPHKTQLAVEKLILSIRRKHRTWGPKKIQDLLLKVHQVSKPPAQSTIGRDPSSSWTE